MPLPPTGTPCSSVARRYRGLSEEIAELEVQIERVAREAAPELTALDGVGPNAGVRGKAHLRGQAQEGGAEMP